MTAREARRQEERQMEKEDQIIWHQLRVDCCLILEYVIQPIRKEGNYSGGDFVYLIDL
jgi:hypothetical protein